MQTALFDYPLPERLIAQRPTDRRDESRLLVVNRASHTVEHRLFRDLPEYLREGDCLFRNNAAVIPARLHATRPTGGQVECLLLRPSQSLRPTGRPQVDRDKSGLPAVGSAEDWWCLLRPGKKLPVGAIFGIEGVFTATVREKNDDGLVRVAFATSGGDILAVANRIGEMPLPPYIHRDPSCRSLLAGDTAVATDSTPSSPASRLLQAEAQSALDRERYQTVYADHRHQVAAAAPTAGLHFTPELLAKIAAHGVNCADLTLHVGLGTFRPIATENVEDHAIHREVYEIGAATQQALAATKGRRVAVGTTSVRTIEDFLSRSPESIGHREASAGGHGDPALRIARGLAPVETAGLLRRAAPRNDGQLSDFIAEAGIFIYPPRTFQGVDALITNFHQPRSTLLCLVAAFLAPDSTDGIAWLKEIYAEAVAREYRFFSYGDAMLIV